MSLRESFRQPTALGYLALIRIAVGYHFINASWGKLARGFGADGLARQLVETAPQDPLALHRAFILDVVVPNADLFSALVKYGELAIGLSLLSGCLVRVASSFGAFHNLNIYLAIAIPNGGAQVGLNRLFVLLHVVFVAAAAGRAVGIDGLLKKRFPRSRLF